MTYPQNPNEQPESISSQLKRQGIKMNKKTAPGNSSKPIASGSGGSVKIPNDGNPNSRSSYDGIFGY